MHLEAKREGEVIAPLEKLTLLHAAPGTIVVEDGCGREYFHAPSKSGLQFVVGGALGCHTVSLRDVAGRVLDNLSFRVDAKTHIHDESGDYNNLLQMLHYTMISEFGETSSVRWRGRIYKFFICWLRDHVHVMKGMKYFAGDLRDGIDLYRDSQREDGMIWDNVHRRTALPNYWDVRFKEGDFIRPFDDYHAEFKRIPAENDVEYLFVEGLYYTWKATGDDGWMQDSLDAAMRALEYSVTSEYRWSKKYKLLKRGYTIDTWDFQSEEDRVCDGDIMRVHPKKTRFGVMFGDNTGYIAACRQVAEMLEHLTRNKDAVKYRKRADEMEQRLNELSWNGKFFTHHIREDSNYKSDFGVDESAQVSLSNAYSLNRGISHEQCVAIIKTYQNIKKRLPEGSPGEWFTIYPPFQKGFGGHSDMWQYMNASVTPIVAGELAHGAFQHGFEDYGVDILNRLIALGKEHGGTFHSSYTGAMPKPKKRSFLPFDIAAVANADTHGTGAPGVPGWTGEGENDLHAMPTGRQTLAGIEWQIPDPAQNGRRGCIGISTRSEYSRHVEISVGRKAESFYFLHAVSQPGPSGVAGTITLHYDDDTTYDEYVVRGRNISGWWFPEAPRRHGQATAQVAWRGQNKRSPDVGLLAYGLNNPHPEKKISKVVLTAAVDGALWMVLGITLSPQPAWFPTNPISFGIPNGWSAAAVVYSMIEGLAGVVDAGVAFNHVRFEPRWAATNDARAETVVKYPDSGGYVAYNYRHDSERRRLELQLTGSGDRFDCHVLLPQEAKKATRVTVDGQPQNFQNTRVEKSTYVDFAMQGCWPRSVAIEYS